MAGIEKVPVRVRFRTDRFGAVFPVALPASLGLKPVHPDIRQGPAQSALRASEIFGLSHLLDLNQGIPVVTGRSAAELRRALFGESR